MLSEVLSGYVDTSVASFSFTLERNEYLQFSLTITKMMSTVLIKTPQYSDFTLSYHIAEFLYDSWIILFLLYITMFVILIVLIHRKKQPNEQQCLENAAEICLKAIISRVSYTFLL